MVGTSFNDIFVDINDSIYVIDDSNNRIEIWSKGNMTPTRTIFSNLNAARGIFAQLDGTVYTIHRLASNTINRWTVNGSNSVVTMYPNGTCVRIFMDINNYLYCSMDPPHQVVKKILDNSMATSIVVAGNGTHGSASNLLYSPRGIFVDRNLNLYVADCGNNRIQIFQPGRSIGRTLSINGSYGTFTLNLPTDVTLDVNGYPFIVDYDNHRILGSDSQGFRCIVGCSHGMGSTSYQLYNPLSFSFDSYGNLLVVDTRNNRLQEFPLTWNECGKF